ncbi:NADH-ubiquinone oxidoreductase-F iron-sulfur binding region domain-containing protein [Candidatus Omnitrophota bacterium]
MDFKEIRRSAKEEWEKLELGQRPIVLVGNATCGRSAGSLEVIDAFRQKSKNLGIDCNIIETGCIGLCYAEPIVCIKKPSRPMVCYASISPTKAKELVEKYLLKDDPLPNYALGTIGDNTIKNIPDLFQAPFFKAQKRIVLRNCGFIDPTNINHSIARQGYSGFINSLNMGSDSTIDMIKKSDLRGRGGAGFPTWRKWQYAKAAGEKEKYLIANADEGDPGAFMNRSLIEGDPHSLIEGMLIAGFAIGANVGYIYCRAEYPLALEMLNIAIKQAEEIGLLGNNILGSRFDFHIKIKKGAGAFVCGEETALIASIEGERGMPRTRPPFPATSGLRGRPTIINNIETLASVSFIMQKGADVFLKHGTKDSSGTKTFALVGKVKNTGLVEVPFGTTLRQMIYDIGGGVLQDKKIKAVQTGGPSGGCVPSDLLDIPVDYDSLKSAGTIMGSGGMVVIDEDTCMVDFARYFIDFTQKESCGKCVPCRLGTKQILEILKDITTGRGAMEDIDLLIELAEAVKLGSLCGLGQTAPNPVLTTIRYFRKEYESHVKDKRCPALACKALIQYSIDKVKCVGCGLCKKACPSKAISGDKKKLHKISRKACVKCGACLEVCKFGAVKIK